jgi:hypothetical protein
MIPYHDIMSTDNDAKRRGRVSEPVQVYLDYKQRARLDSLARQLDLTRSDVVRRGLEALENEVADPEHHPALRVIGLAGDLSGRDAGHDVARMHDRYLADAELASWAVGKIPSSRRRSPRAVKGKRRKSSGS